MGISETMPKNNSPYRFIKTNINHRGERLIPMCCFGEKRNWIEIAKELDLITKKYGCEFPEFDNRHEVDAVIHTKKGSKTFKRN
jgi:hypothetical protein